MAASACVGTVFDVTYAPKKREKMQSRGTAAHLRGEGVSLQQSKAVQSTVFQFTEIRNWKGKGRKIEKGNGKERYDDMIIKWDHEKRNGANHDPVTICVW